MGCGVAGLQVAGLCSPEAREKVGPGLKRLCTALGMPPVLGFWTCTDTGRCADLLATISEAPGGVPLPDLPVAVAAPEYMEQKATIDALFALALGLYTYVNPVPTMTGGPDRVKLLTEERPGITGGVLHVKTDVAAATEGMLAHIEEKRAKLGI